MPFNPVALSANHTQMITDFPVFNSYAQYRLISQMFLQHLPLDVEQVSPIEVENILLILPLPPTLAPYLSPTLSLLSSIRWLFYQKFTSTIWKALMVTLFLFITHIYSTHQHISPNTYVITTSSAHIPTWVSTVSHLDYAKILHLCLCV